MVWWKIKSKTFFNLTFELYMNMESSYVKKTDIELLSIVPKNSVDLVLTDPPYIISKGSGMDEYKKTFGCGR